VSVLLPDICYIDSAVIPVRFGGILRPSSGGPEMILNRLGDRTSVRVTTPPLMNTTDGRILFQRLLRGLSDGVLMKFPNRGSVVGSPGSPVVSVAVSGGSAVTIGGLSSGYTIREGQPFSIIHGGRRYLYFSNQDATASGGSASTTVRPLIRTPLSIGDVVELAAPMIEGIVDGDPTAWERSAANMAPFTFTVREIE
jgi:hypothetical protein